jgi:squalene-associated FAD-dependent desaturase
VDRVEDLAPALSARAAPAPAPGRRAAVIGAGWAGCAAALELARQGFAVTVFEAARVPGGRARRVVVDGMALDNGQHLLVGAYHECLRLIDSCRGASPGAPAAYARLPLTLVPWGRFAGAVRLAAWRVPAPLHLAAALATARGLPLGSRVALAASFLRARRGGGSIPERASVAEWFRSLPRDAFAGVVAPLCVAALNTLPDEASARVFANVLARTLLAGSRADSDFVIPATDLSALLPEPALREVVARGGTLRLSVSARVVAAAAGRVAVAAGGEAFAFDGAVIAVAPHQLDGALGPDVAARGPCRSLQSIVAGYAYEPISTVYLGCDRPVPLAAPMLRLDDRPGQWLFARRLDPASATPANVAALLAIVISAHGSHERLAQDELARAVETQLRRLAPGFPAVAWSRVITERRATYACVPALPRPAATTLGPGLHLAGDYTDPELPATLEAAVKSGCAAARSLGAQCRLSD